MTALDLVLLYRAGVTVEAVQLTEANHNIVFEWAESKPYYDPRPHGAAEKDPLPISGLTIFTPAGRRKAEYGDWVIRRGGEWHTATTGELAVRFGEFICPECRCDPTTCERDDTGDHCEAQACGPCLHGCPLDICPAHPEVR